MDDPAGDPGTVSCDCEQCGLCCRIFGNSIIPTPMNIFGWIEQGRVDILRFFTAVKEDGSHVNCSKIPPDDLGSVVLIEMRDPETGQYMTVCPFLKRIRSDTYLCGIHAVKPDMCRSYQPWIWGETYFGRCRTLTHRENRYAWRHICE